MNRTHAQITKIIPWKTMEVCIFALHTSPHPGNHSRFLTPSFPHFPSPDQLNALQERRRQSDKKREKAECLFYKEFQRM